MFPGKTAPATTRNTKVVESMVGPKNRAAPTTPKGSMFGFGVKAAAQGAAIEILDA